MNIDAIQWRKSPLSTNRYRLSPLPYTLPLLLLLPAVLFCQSANFQIPIEGEEGRDFFIVNYVDHASEENVIRDYRCGTKTYDGHQGTDFTLRSFAQMDSGVAVLAAADGIVFAVIDSLYDRNKESVVERGFGNWIGIAHEGGWYTYYAHIRKESATVTPGERVQAGAKLALVGSSGNSSDPHLHFEVWKIDTTLRDPFGAGDCGDAQPLWNVQPRYDTDYRPIDHGLLNWVPTLDTLRERPATPERFAPPDSVVAFWIHQQGLQRGDVSRIEWRRTSDDLLWFDYQFPAESNDWWYHYFWSYITLPPSDEYRVRYFINNELKAERRFNVQGVTGIAPNDKAPSGISVRYLPGEWNILSVSINDERTSHAITADLFDQLGRRIARLLENERISSRRILDLEQLNLSAGRYILRITENAESIAVPIWLE